MAFKINTPFEFDIKVKLNQGSIGDLDKQVTHILRDIINDATDYIIANFQSLVIDRLVYGGQGWYGIVNTPMWDYVSSKEGAGEIGFTSHLQKYTLLVAYLDSWKIKKMRGGFEFMFGDISAIRRATKHPAAGIGKLPSNRSWFDWLCINEFYVEKEPAAFLKTGKRGARSFKVAGSEAGIMKSFNFFKRHKVSLTEKHISRKSWRPPTKAIFSPDRLLNRNKVKIISTIRQVYFDYIYKELNIVENI